MTTIVSLGGEEVSGGNGELERNVIGSAEEVEAVLDAVRDVMYIDDSSRQTFPGEVSFIEAVTDKTKVIGSVGSHLLEKLDSIARKMSTGDYGDGAVATYTGSRDVTSNFFKIRDGLHAPKTVTHQGMHVTSIFQSHHKTLQTSLFSATVYNNYLDNMNSVYLSGVDEDGKPNGLANGNSLLYRHAATPDSVGATRIHVEPTAESVRVSEGMYNSGSGKTKVNMLMSYRSTESTKMYIPEAAVVTNSVSNLFTAGAFVYKPVERSLIYVLRLMDSDVDISSKSSHATTALRKVGLYAKGSDIMAALHGARVTIESFQQHSGSTGHYGYHGAKELQGLRRLALKAHSVVVPMKSLNKRDGRRGLIPCDIVLSLLETVEHKDGILTGVATFLITIMPQFTFGRAILAHTDAVLSPYKNRGLPGVNNLACRVIHQVPDGVMDPYNYQHVPSIMMEKDLAGVISLKMASGDGFICVEGILREAGSFPIPHGGVEFDDLILFTLEEKKFLSDLMAHALTKGRNLTPETLRDVLQKRLIPVVGVGSRIWLPAYLNIGDFESSSYDLDDLLARWALCFLFSVSLPAEFGQGTALLPNYWRSCAAQIPACVASTLTLLYSPSPAQLLVLKDFEVPDALKNTHALKMRGGLVHNAHVRNGIADLLEFDFGVQGIILSGPMRSETPPIVGRAFTGDGNGNYWTHELQIAEIVARAEQLSLAKGGKSLSLCMWHPLYMIIVSYDHSLKRAVSFIHSSVRPSKLVKTYHAQDKTSSQEKGGPKRINPSALGIKGALGFVRGMNVTVKTAVFDLFESQS